jgi:DNA-directed RNA polymerase specialized sigma24 family protein
MKKEWVLTKEAFDQLLNWLSPDSRQAGRKYESIRRRLIEIFASRGCYEAEELADETINRVTTRLPEIIKEYRGDPALYFYGVAYNVRQEFLRRNRRRVETPVLTSPPAAEWGKEMELQCLEHCIERLPVDSRVLVTSYYLEDRTAQQDFRKKLAGKLDLSFNALRIRAHRVKASLRECVQGCIERDDKK